MSSDNYKLYSNDFNAYALTNNTLVLLKLMRAKASLLHF